MSASNAAQILVLGAHHEPTRYAYKALKLLEASGYSAVPINPRFETVLGKHCYPSVAKWASETGLQADTLTFYLNPAHSSKLIEELIAHKPRRAIFNPGAENPDLERALKKVGVEVLHDCTLVMLEAGRF